ncbi:MAG: VCBS repeat-containing protein [Candidatus Omnitrophica bacterium]|nr:VCBS repeat-containing protein [Candidatus Omnitrophota bacterium]
MIGIITKLFNKCPANLFAILFITIASSSGGENPQRLAPLLELIQKNDAQSALTALQDIVFPLDANERSVLLKTIESHSLRGEWIPFLETLVEKIPDDAELIYLLARACWRAGDEESAMKWVALAIQTAPEDESILYRAAAIAYAVNRFEQAQEWVHLLLEKNAEHLDGQFLLGCIHARRGEYDQAEKQFLQILRFNPRYYMAYYELGKLFNQKGQSEQAEHYLRQAIHGYPFFREAMNALMVALARQDKKEELEKIKPVFERLNSWDNEKLNRIWYSFRRPSEISNQMAEELAVELTYLHREEDAKKYLEHRLEIDKSSDFQKIMLARFYFNGKQYAACLNILDKIQSEKQKETEIYGILKAWSLYYEGKIDESRDYYEAYIKQFPQSRHLKDLGQKSKEAISRNSSKQDDISPASRSRFHFIDAAEKSGLSSFRHILGHPEKIWITDAMGSGVAVGDYDNDGDDDIYFVCGRPELDRPDPQWRNALFRNDGGAFTDVTETAGVGDAGFGMCAVWGDVDGDGWNDLFVGNYGENALYKNNGDGTFSNVSRKSGVNDPGYAAAAVFGDVDRDGDLDLFVGNYVDFAPDKHGEMRTNYHGVDVFMGPLAFPHQNDLIFMNDGKGVFVNRAEEAGINASKSRAMGAVLFDLENDGDLDLYVTNDSTYNHVLHNDGAGHFEDISFLSGGAFTESGVEGASMGVISGDYDNDGYFDLFITSYEQQTDILFHNNGHCILTDATARAGLNLKSRMLITWGSAFCDFDSDGRLDLFTSNGHLYPQVDSLQLGLRYDQGASFYRNTGKRFEDVSPQSLPPDFSPKSGRGAALIDYDSDGDMDIVINNIDESPMLLENRSARGNWLQVDLKASSSEKLGVRVVARKDDQRWTRMVDGGSSYLSQHSSLLHFGFGSVESIDDLTIYWMHREPQIIPSPPLNQRITIRPADGP